MGLKTRWVRDTRDGVRGEWWLTADDRRDAPNRAFITFPDSNGDLRLNVWCKGPDGNKNFVEHAKGTDLRALKAIGRIEAVRNLHV